jgi:hypothetical protein
LCVTEKKRESKGKGNMESKLEQFVGNFTNAISNELCSEFIDYFNGISKAGLTMSSMQENNVPLHKRKDEVIGIPLGLPRKCFPTAICQPLWNNVSECLALYSAEYDVGHYITSHDFKIHRVQPTGGYHVWHHEHCFNEPYRVLAWHITLEAPKRGGETEFLYQSMRIKPEVGKLTIWPAGFTHMHRGNPPLEGQKTYITGWFELLPPQ